MNTVPEVLRSIADNIETYGHYQGQKDQRLLESATPFSKPGQCCLIVNPTLRSLKHNSDLYWATKDTMFYAFAGYQTSIAHYSDITPTETLLAELRDLADSLEAKDA